jgi:hypothetical protein
MQRDLAATLLELLAGHTRARIVAPDLWRSAANGGTAKLFFFDQPLSLFGSCFFTMYEPHNRNQR